MREKVEVQCSYCKDPCMKDKSEVKRNEDLGRKNYCSRLCLGKDNTKNLPIIKDASHLDPANRKDKFTGFREHLRRVYYRQKDSTLNLQDLKEVFDLQNGICPYSGVRLQPVPKRGKSDPIYTMSLDRKNSDLGYTRDNIQFISISMNHLKNSMTEEQMIEVLSILKNKS